MIDSCSVKRLLRGEIECLVIDNFDARCAYAQKLLLSETTKIDARSTWFHKSIQGEHVRRDEITWLPTKYDGECEIIAVVGADNILSALISSLLRLPTYFSECLNSFDNSMPRANNSSDESKINHRFVAPPLLQLSHYNCDGGFYRVHRDAKCPGQFNIDDDFAWVSNSSQRLREFSCILYITPEDWKVSHGDAKENQSSEINSGGAYDSGSSSIRSVVNSAGNTTPESCDTAVGLSPYDGGCLRVFLGCAPDDDSGCTAQEIFDIAPISGRLVIFPSAKVPHEVRPCRRAGRFALTMWVLRAENSRDDTKVMVEKTK